MRQLYAFQHARGCLLCSLLTHSRAFFEKRVIGAFDECDALARATWGARPYSRTLRRAAVLMMLRVADRRHQPHDVIRHGTRLLALWRPGSVRMEVVDTLGQAYLALGDQESARRLLLAEVRPRSKGTARWSLRHLLALAEIGGGDTEEWWAAWRWHRAALRVTDAELGDAPLTNPLDAATRLQQVMITRIEEDARRRKEIVATHANGQPAHVRDWSSDSVWVELRYSDAGMLEAEAAFQKGLKVGIERTFHPDGSVHWERRWRGGLQHGTAHQYAVGDRCIGTYTMERGTGWFLRREDDPAGVYLAEARHEESGRLSGPAWWFSPTGALTREAHLLDDQPHGYEMRWSASGPEAGFPLFWLHGEPVDAARYAAARLDDPRLPALNLEARRPPSSYPQPVAEALGKATP